MGIKGILFDKDGTLFDFEATFAGACAAVLDDLAAGDPALAGEMAEAAGFDPVDHAFLPDSAVIAGSTDDLAALWAPSLNGLSGRSLSARIDELFERHTRGRAALFPAVVEVLETLAALGLSLGIATNDSRAGALAHAGAAGIDGHFGFIAGYDSGFGQKPGSGMVTGFARHCSARAHEIAMVGDSLHDMMAARGAGAVAVAVCTGPATARELAPCADHVLDSLDALPSLAERLLSGQADR